MHRTNIYLDDEQCAVLDRVAGEEGRSRSEVIRRLIDRAVGGEDDDIDDDLLAIRESFAVLRDSEPVTRGRDGRAEHLDRIWRRTG